MNGKGLVPYASGDDYVGPCPRWWSADATVFNVWLSGAPGGFCVRAAIINTEEGRDQLTPPSLSFSNLQTNYIICPPTAFHQHTLATTGWPIPLSLNTHLIFLVGSTLCCLFSFFGLPTNTPISLVSYPLFHPDCPRYPNRLPDRQDAAEARHVCRDPAGCV